jgi:hypothetical protein
MTRAEERSPARSIGVCGTCRSLASFDGPSANVSPSRLYGLIKLRLDTVGSPQCEMACLSSRTTVSCSSSLI